MTDVSPHLETFLPAHDLHNHTTYCGHAAEDATVANLVERAEKVGLETFGFSEHVIFPEDVDRIARIRDDLARLEQGIPRVRILVGVEIDADPLNLDGRLVADPGPVDYIILSPHRIPEYGIGHWQFKSLALSRDEQLRLADVWLDWYAACIERNEVDILGHPFREPITLGLLSLKQERTFARILEILRRAAHLSLVFELNNGWAIGLQELGQFEEYVVLVRELKKCGMKFSRGSDSHGEADVGTCDGIRRLAREAGLEQHDWLDR